MQTVAQTKGFVPSTAQNRRARRAHLNSYGLHKPERKNLLLVIGKTKFKHFVQTINFLNRKTGRQEIRKITHLEAYPNVGKATKKQ